MEFTFESYRNLIEISIKNNYKFCSYKDVDKYNKAIILRHDIDFSPNKALEIAKIEQKLGVKSTYFVILTTQFYNVFSKETADIFHQIMDMGHELGLHFDEQKYESTTLEQMKDYVHNESEILGKALSTRINVVSMHRPSKFTLDASIEFDGLINSYSNKYFKNIKYISDSRMCWREDPMDTIINNHINKIHILTHPFWYSEKIENIQNKLSEFITKANACRYDLIDKNFRELDEYLNREDFL